MTSQPLDPSAFRDFEHAGWEKLPKRYHDSFASLTSQAIGPLLDAADARRGMRLLDVATGPGYVVAAAVERGADVVGLDFSAAMLDEACRRNPGVDFQEGDAERLPFADASFDAVAMNFGLLHLARPEQALAEAQRVLRPGGKLGFTVWAKPEEAVGFGIVLRAIQSCGNVNVPLPAGPPFFRFSEPQECRRVLFELDFVTPDVRTIPQVWRLASRDVLFEIMRGSTVRTGGLLRAQAPQALEAIRTSVRNATGLYQRGNLIELPMPAILAWASKR